MGGGTQPLLRAFYFNSHIYKGLQMSKTKVDNLAPSHKYFTQMLNIAEDDLDPFQYRLLAHYVRWTGHGGESDESIRTAAKSTRMGVNKIRSTLDELVLMGYIAVERPTPQEARNGKTIHITILDRWLDNITRYQKGVSNTIQGNAIPVSNQIHTPVSNQIRLEEQDIKEPNTRKRSKSAPKLSPSVIFRQEWEAYSVMGMALLKEFASDFIPVENQTVASLTPYLEVAKELTSVNAMIEQIPLLGKYVAKRAKDEDWSKYSVKTYARYYTDFLKQDKQSHVYDGSENDLSRKPDITPILMQKESA